MKNNYFYVILISFSFVVSFSWAQTTETFESYTTGKPQTFTSNSQSFTLTSNCATGAGVFGVFIPGQTYKNCAGNDATSTGTGYGVGTGCASAGCGGNSNKFIDNGASAGLNQTYSIKTTNNALFTIKSVYVFISTNGGTSSSTSAGVTFRGKNAGSTVFTLTNPTLTANSNGFTFIDFVTVGYGSVNIDQLEIQGGATVNYLAIDNFRWHGPTTLPVELVSFTAKPIATGAEINWKTSAESNSSHFELWHSTDEGKPKQVTTIEALGDSKTGKSYSFIHTTPLNGNNYYQLLQFDKDGNKADLGVKKAEFRGLADDQIILYPNPTTNSVTVKFAAKTYVKIEVVDIFGKVVNSQSIGTTETERKMDLSGLPNGTYTLLLSDKSNKSAHKLIKL